MAYKTAQEARNAKSHPKSSGGNIKNEAGMSESNKYGDDLVSKALYESGYGGRKSPGKNTVLSMGQGQTIKNDEGISESNKFGKQMSSKVDSLTDYYGKHTSDIKAGVAKQTIQNDEGIDMHNVWGTAALKTREMDAKQDWGKSGKAELKSLKIPFDQIFGREKMKYAGEFEQIHSMVESDSDEDYT